jgi:hypothetical protein
MSLRALPWTIIPVILYNAIALWGGDAPDNVLHSNLFSIRMLQGAVWNFTWGDLIVLLTMVVLFVELIKATYTSTISLVDHGLSMLVFIICIVEFLLVNGAATSTFFLVMVGSLIDVVAGFTIGIRVARRDLSIGGGV